MKYFLSSFLLLAFLNGLWGQQVTVPAAQTDVTLTNPFGGGGTNYSDLRYNYILTSAQLSTAGLSINNVLTSIGFNFSNGASTSYPGLTIAIKHTTANTLSAFDDAGLTTVYSGAYTVPATGWQQIPFSTNFAWNGTNNLLISICWDRTATGAGAQVGFNNTTVTGRAVFNQATSGTGCTLATASQSANVPMTRFQYTPGLTPTLNNFSANPALSTSFAHRRGASERPKFTVSSSSNFDAVQIELNHFANFSGPAIVSTIADGTNYNASTPYDFWTTEV